MDFVQLMNYYNEWDGFAASWLKKLIAEGLIPKGEVDQRSIAEVTPKDLKGFTQCHFFAGIGGWSLALELAEWDATRPVWTGSPPCQPFSNAGNRKGNNDERHLWPVFFDLISQCQPPTVFGEQVAPAIKSGWFDDLQSDMETVGYASAMAVLPACSVGAPHKRDRIFYVAETMADAERQRLQGGIYRGPSEERQMVDRHFGRDRTTVQCKDGRQRPIPVEPALFPLVDGVSNRMGILRGAGNAIVPQVGAKFVKAYMGA